MSDPAISEHEELEHHPSPRQYVNIAIILSIVTALEVAIFYIDTVRDILVPSLLALSAIKFALVVLWFMHLKFDSHLFRRLFVTGLVLAGIVFAVVLTIFFARGGAAPIVTG